MSAVPRARRQAAAQPGLIWEGSFFVHHSLANVNCEIAIALTHAGVDLGLIPYEPHQYDHHLHPRYAPVAERIGRRPSRVQAHVRHRWPPRFARPKKGRFVLMQPWEFGTLPRRWIPRIARDVDEVWVPSRWVRGVYARSGVDARKVVVVPQGVDPDVFHPGAPPLRLPTARTFRFLFVGGSLERKGFDLLLAAYSEEFTRDDDVCLVIKDFFYGGYGRADVAAVRRKPRAPEIRYSYGNRPAHEIAGLYTACDCYVHPFRGEGFGLPIVEAMACGLPVIVTGRGPALDYCTHDHAYLLDAEEQLVPGDWDPRFPTVRPPTWFEPDRQQLRRAMRAVFERRDEARRKGRRASAHIRARFTWQRAAARICARLDLRPDTPARIAGGD
jgi:glycosyltransferase involved in cell wall biosynthesis